MREEIEREKQQWHRRATSPNCHGCHRASFGKPLGQPSPPIDAGCRDESKGGDRVAGDLAVDELSPLKVRPLRCASDGWGQVDCRTPLSATRFVVRRVHLAASRVLLIFVLFFYRF
jgi:hypothetical protein